LIAALTPAKPRMNILQAVKRVYDAIKRHNWISFPTTVTNQLAAALAGR
jgi:hypothetical protein